MSALLREFRHAFRALARQPVLSSVAVLTLVLGIGANTAIFSLVKGVLLDSLPYVDPGALVVLSERNPQGGLDFVSPPNYHDWQDRASSFDALAAYRHVRYGFETDEEPLDLPCLTATPELFDVLRARPVLGRVFSKEEGVWGNDKVAVLSYGMWQRYFGGSPSVLGREIELDGVRYKVIGVMAEDFSFPPGNEIHLWTALAFDPNDVHGRSRRARALSVVGRLAAGVTIEQAREEMSAISAALADDYADTNAGWGAAVESAHEKLVESARPALLLLLAAVGFLLLIVCANVANLMLARLTTRRREVALRAALGAGRLALVRQVLSESFLLAFAGGALGLPFAYVALRIVRALPVTNVPRLHEVTLDTGVLAFTAIVSLVVALGFGLLPAIDASRPRLRDSLNETSRGGSPRVQRLLSIVVAAEVALALLLLVGAGLMIKGFREMMRVDPGFAPTKLLAVQIYLPRARYPNEAARLGFFTNTLERIRALPGVERAAAVSSLPMYPVGIDFALPFSIEGRNPPASGEEPRADIRSATEGYIETMKIPLLRGRTLDARDRDDAPRVALINATLARRYFVDEEPLGKVIDSPHGKAEIIGVVADVHHYGLDTEPRPELYLAFDQNVFNGMSVVVRTSIEPEELASRLREVIHDEDASQAIYDMSTMEQAISRWVFLPRLSTTLLSIFALMALVLAVIGIYGVIAYSVSQRTTEMGLRMALGAGASDLVRLVVKDSMVFVGLGMMVGVAGALVLTRFLSDRLAAVRALDPLVYVGVVVLLGGAALLASYLPARRATRVDPIEALRVE